MDSDCDRAGVDVAEGVCCTRAVVSGCKSVGRAEAVMSSSWVNDDDPTPLSALNDANCRRALRAWAYSSTCCRALVVPLLVDVGRDMVLVVLVVAAGVSRREASMDAAA